MTSTESVGTVTLQGGAASGGLNTITSTPGNTGSAVLTIANLVRGGAGATVNFTGTNLGQDGLGNSQINLTQINTAAPTLVQNMIGGWATVNGTDFASYIAPGANQGQGGVGALGSLNYALYSVNPLTAVVATDNITIAGNPSANIGNTTVNSLRFSAAATVTQTAATTLTITSGGLLFNGAASVITGGNLTAGSVAGAELFAYTNNTATIASVITNNAGGAVSLVKSGTSTLTLTGNNTYTGNTFVNQGTLTLSTTGANGGSTVF